jgi:hypothetical protein
LIAAALAVNFDHMSFREEPLDIEFTLRSGEFQIDASLKRAFHSKSEPSATQRTTELKPSLYESGRYVFRTSTGAVVTLALSTDTGPERTVEGIDAARYGLADALSSRHQRPPLAPGFHGLCNGWFQGSSYAWSEFESLIFEHEKRILHAADNAPFRMAEGDDLLEIFGDEESFTIQVGLGFSKPRLLPDEIFSALKDDGSTIEVPLVVKPLAAFIRELGFSEGRMSLGPPRVERHYGSEAFAYSSPTFTFYRDGRLVRRIDQLSYGQRRLFALGWYLACVCDVAILDEPSNGLHESWAEFLVAQLRDRQVFLTSQNANSWTCSPSTRRRN